MNQTPDWGLFYLFTTKGDKADFSPLGPIFTDDANRLDIIHADATLPAGLEAAGGRHCQAQLAVTNDDMINLEIAFTAKGLVPKRPVVVLDRDPHFAMMVKQVFDFEAVLSPTEIAAPSFAAAAIGGRIFGSGMTAGNLWIALATLITPAHPFCNQLVKDIAMNADYVSLYIDKNDRTIHGWELLECRLLTGDILYLKIPANRL